MTTAALPPTDNTTGNACLGCRQEPILCVDGTPDAGYVLRILRAYRENCNCKWAYDGEEEMLRIMNEACDARAKLLDEAIARLEE